jgi:hypothetical protein
MAAPLVAQAQDPPSPLVEITPFGGLSILESFDGLRVGDDVVTYGLRGVLPGPGFQPWLEVSRFERPGLECLEDIPCNDAGWAIRVGGVAVLSPAPARPGIHPRLMGGIGVAFSEETIFSHLLGLGFAWRLNRRFSPVFDTRWEGLPGINIFIMNLGLRIDVP